MALLLTRMRRMMLAHRRGRSRRTGLMWWLERGRKTASHSSLQQERWARLLRHRRHDFGIVCRIHILLLLLLELGGVHVRQWRGIGIVRGEGPVLIRFQILDGKTGGRHSSRMQGRCRAAWRWKVFVHGGHTKGRVGVVRVRMGIVRMLLLGTVVVRAAPPAAPGRRAAGRVDAAPPLRVARKRGREGGMRGRRKR